MEGEGAKTVRTGGLGAKMLFKETITLVAEAEAGRQHDVDGKSEYAHVAVRVRPLERGAGVRLGPIDPRLFPAEYFPGVEVGLMSALASGPAGRYEVTDLEVEIVDGGYHAADSSVLAFASATEEAVRKALRAAHPRLLEARLEVTIDVPNDSMAMVLEELNNREGRISSVDLPTLQVDSGAINIEAIIKASLPERAIVPIREWLAKVLGDRAGFLTGAGDYDLLPVSIARQALYCGNCERKVLPATPGTCPDCALPLQSGDDFTGV